MSDPRHRLGLQAEDRVAAALEAGGWRILARRWRVPEGEIDLVGLDPHGHLVAVEVRARRSDRTGGARESVRERHVRRLRAALRRYAGETHVGHAGLRVDLVSVEWSDGSWRATRIAGIGGW